MARLCSVCHEPYYRSNRARMWVSLGAGMNQKVDEPVCTTCCPPKQAQRILVASHFRVVSGKAHQVKVVPDQAFITRRKQQMAAAG